MLLEACGISAVLQFVQVSSLRTQAPVCLVVLEQGWQELFEQSYGWFPKLYKVLYGYIIRDYIGIMGNKIETTI